MSFLSNFCSLENFVRILYEEIRESKVAAKINIKDILKNNDIFFSLAKMWYKLIQITANVRLNGYKKWKSGYFISIQWRNCLLELLFKN